MTSGVARGYGVTFDAADDVYAVGTFEGTVDFGGGPLVSAGGSDVFLVKYSASGDHLWSRRFGGPEEEDAPSVAVDASGAVYLGAETDGSQDFAGAPFEGPYGDGVATKLSSDGTVLWSKHVVMYAIALVAAPSGGGVLISGISTTQLGFLSAFGPDGTLLWTTPENSSFFPAWLNPLAVNAMGNAFLVGYAGSGDDLGAGPMDGELTFLKYTADGSILFDKRYPKDVGFFMTTAASSDGGAVLAGSLSESGGDFGGGLLHGPTGADSTSFLVKFDAAGNHVSSAAHPGFPVSIALDTKDNVLLTGEGYDGMDLGGGPRHTNPDVVHSAYVAKLAPDGSHIWSTMGGARGVGLDVAASATSRSAVVGYFSGSLDFGAGVAEADFDNAFIAVFPP